MKKLLAFTAFALIFAVSCSNGSSKISPNTVSDNDPDQSAENDGDYEVSDDSNTGDTETNDGNSDTTDTDPSDADNVDSTPDHDPVIVEGLNFESGFIDIEENEYYLSKRENKSGRVKMWYNFQPADENPQDKPLFVFYNGGPGSSSALVFLYNTAKKTADQAFAGEGVADNEYNWNQLGNLLYVDARQTGFSYGIVDNPSSSSVRSAYFSTSNFNVFIDAADFIRVVLRFLESHPSIKSNKVVFAGESYGGTRTTAIINVLQNVADYSQNNRVFYDAALFEEIARHFREIDPSITGMPSKEIVSKQFGGQILIQPLIMGEKQMDMIGEILEKSDSPLFTIQKETGKQYTPCGNSSWGCDKHTNALNYVKYAGRDIYAYRKPSNWLFDYTDVGTAKMLKISMFGQFTMNNPTEIKELYAENRKEYGAFRYSNSSGYSRDLAYLDNFANLPEAEKIILRTRIEQRNAHPLTSGDLESVFGTLPNYDEYYVDLNYTINSTFYNASVSPYSDINGEMFLENIKTTKTFITHAEEDIIVYAEATPETAKSFSGVSSVETGDESFTVHFTDGQSATVTFPFYPESSHSVSVNQPEKFFNDVKTWMNK